MCLQSDRFDRSMRKSDVNFGMHFDKKSDKLRKSDGWT